MRNRKLQSIALLLLLGAFATPAHADFVLNFAESYSGGTPVGAGPWLTATFHTVSPGEVYLTLSNHLAADFTEFISTVFLNVHPAAGDPSLLDVAWDPQANDPMFWGVTKGKNCCQADGDGFYDLEFQFTMAKDEPRFVFSREAHFILKMAGLTENSFRFPSSPGSRGDAGPFFGAAHVLSQPAVETVAWIDAPAPVPEPSSVLLLTTAVAGLVFAARKRFVRTRPGIGRR